MPDIVGDRWSEVLRQYISPTGEAASLLGAAQTRCEKHVAVKLSNEISSIEREWLDTTAVTPPLWVRFRRSS